MVSRRDGHQHRKTVRAVAAAAILFTTLWALSSPVVATHEVDHRFTVEGFVCGVGGQPAADQKVIVKDTRVSVVETAYTDSYGYYKATLHLHDDNLGDPVLIIAGDQEQKTKVQFDPEDRSSERSIRVDFGTGCAVEREPPAWLLYAAGVIALLLAAYAGTRMVRKLRKAQRRAKKPHKKHET